MGVAKHVNFSQAGTPRPKKFWLLPCVLQCQPVESAHSLLLGEPTHAAENDFQERMAELRDYLRDMSLDHVLFDRYSAQPSS